MLQISIFGGSNWLIGFLTQVSNGIEGPFDARPDQEPAWMKGVDLGRKPTSKKIKSTQLERFKHRLLIIIYFTFTASRYPGIFMVHLMYLFTILAASFQQGHPLKGNSLKVFFLEADNFDKRPPLMISICLDMYKYV